MGVGGYLLSGDLVIINVNHRGIKPPVFNITASLYGHNMDVIIKFNMFSEPYANYMLTRT